MPSAQLSRCSASTADKSSPTEDPPTGPPRIPSWGARKLLAQPLATRSQHQSDEDEFLQHTPAKGTPECEVHIRRPIGHQQLLESADLVARRLRRLRRHCTILESVGIKEDANFCGREGHQLHIKSLLYKTGQFEPGSLQPRRTACQTARSCCRGPRRQWPKRKNRRRIPWSEFTTEPRDPSKRRQTSPSDRFKGHQNIGIGGRRNQDGVRDGCPLNWTDRNTIGLPRNTTM